jgi:hypothetical protein
LPNHSSMSNKLDQFLIIAYDFRYYSCQSFDHDFLPCNVHM